MLTGWKKVASIIVCALAVAPLAAQSQSPNQAQSPNRTQYPTGTNPTSPQQPGSQSPYQPRLTPQQQAAQQRAAQENNAQQRTAQQAYSTQNMAGPTAGIVNAPTRPAATPAIVLPAGFPLSAEHSKYVNDLLDYWEQSSLAVKKYKCKFQRFEYDTSIVAYRDPQTQVLAAYSQAFGEIRFAEPDRARFETTKILDFKAPPQKQGDLPTYLERPNESKDVLERWVCDGKTVYDFDFKQKRMYESEIPKDLRGNVAHSPLPFVFGANKKQILERYWVRSITPRGAKNEYWLEIYPKRIEDARTYSKIEVVIANEDWLPKAIHLYSPQYDPSNGNYSSRYFLFENREVNGRLAKLTDWMGSFIKPQLPLFGGWKTIKTPMGQEPTTPAPVMRNAAGQPARIK